MGHFTPYHTSPKILTKTIQLLVDAPETIEKFCRFKSYVFSNAWALFLADRYLHRLHHSIDVNRIYFFMKIKKSKETRKQYVSNGRQYFHNAMYRSYLGSQCEKTYLLIYVPNKYSNQLSHPRSLIRVCVVIIKKLCILAYPNMRPVKVLIRLRESSMGAHVRSYFFWRCGSLGKEIENMSIF